MRSATRLALLAALLLVPVVPAVADKVPYERTREEVEAALDLRTALLTPARIRPRQPVRFSAQLVNRSKGVVRVVRPGTGCDVGIVEPHIRTTARYRPFGQTSWQDAPVRSEPGICGMGDYRWHRNVVPLAPGASLDFTDQLQPVSTFVDLEQPGHYELTLHYAFRRRGTTQRLPQADPPGDLGPMRRMPAFEIASEPVHVYVVRPVEIVAEARAGVQKGVARRLSDLVHVRLENWTGAPLELRPGRLRITVRLRPGGARIRRKPISVKAGLVRRTLAAGASITLVGRQGLYDEAWAVESDGPVQLQIAVSGIGGQGGSVRSARVSLVKP
ncbi:MAG: hypothetical protein QNJ90_07835 [Planctomycetota bacterium]|nr:hypothetical protein [Planctomycetota bacterium]